MVLLLGVAVVVLARNADTLRQGFRALGNASPYHVVIALFLVVITFFLAAILYGVLALKPLRYGATVLIEFAAAAVNRFLPSGIGSLGVHGLYLYGQKHTAAQATVVVSVNNLIGIAIHMLLLAFILVMNPGILTVIDINLGSRTAVLLGTTVIILLAIVGSIPTLRLRVKSFGKSLILSLRTYANRPLRLLLACLLAATLSVLYAATLQVCADAVGVHVPFAPAFIIFSLGVLVGTATPTPGGLVGAEAGLFAGFVAFGVAQDQALAAALLFRLTSYWLPVLPGSIALVIARRRALL